MGDTLIVTVVPVARYKAKLSLAGTVKPLMVIVVHLTALATSVECENHTRVIRTTAMAYLIKN
jgi:hypothetical protein